MADIDLATALNMFKSGMQDFTFSRAVMNADNQVQQIKSSDMNDQQQRAQLQQLSNSLVAKMAATGAPATTIQAVAGAIGPKQYANANSMNLDSLLTGNETLGSEARKQQAFEQDPEFQIQKLQAKAAAAQNAPLRAMQFQAMQDERFTKHIEGLDKRVDVQTARFGNVAKLQGVNNQIQDALTLFDHPENINAQQITEVARKFDGILSQGASTVTGTKELEPHTLNQMLAKSKEFVTSKPQAVNMQDFINFYRESFQRIKQVNDGIILGAQKNVIQSVGSPIAKQNPEMFKLYVQKKLGEDVDVNPKTGEINWKGPLNTNNSPAATNPSTGMTPVMVRDKVSGKRIKALQGPDGSLYPANGS